MKRGFTGGAAAVITGEISSAVIKKAIASGADLLEVRVDTFAELETEGLISSFKKLKSLIKSAHIPVLLTVRSKKEGGRFIPDEKRAEIFQVLIPFADIVDIELSSGSILENVVDFAGRAGKTVIISYHNFKTTPGLKTLQEIIRKGRASGGDIVKIAATAKKSDEMRRLARLLCEYRGLIVVAMGDAGIASRVFFPSLGSLVTYGSTTRSTAPGQISLVELKKALKRWGLDGWARARKDII